MTDRSVRKKRIEAEETVIGKRRRKELQEALKRLTGEGSPEPLRLCLHKCLGSAGPEVVPGPWVELLQTALAELHRMPEAAADRASQVLDAFVSVAEEKGVPAQVFLKAAVVELLEQVPPEKAGRNVVQTDTRERILAAALDVFSEKGFHHATMDEIAERAGVGKGTVYRYFSSKDNLFSQLVQARLQELEREAEEVLDSDDDVLSMIEKYLGIYFAFFDRNQRLYRVMVQEHPELDDRLQDLYVEEIMRRIPRLRRKIYEARRRGLLKDVDFHTVFYGVMGFIHGVIQRWLAHECAYSLEQELATVKEVLFYGFVNRQNTNTGG